MFTRNNLDYGQYHSDIDILAINVVKAEIWDCEVKVRTGNTIISDTIKKQNGFQHFVETFKNTDRINIIKSLVPECYNIKSKFITTKSLFGKSEDGLNKWIDKFKENEIEVIFFDEIIRDINDISINLKKTTNGIIQTLRLFNLYKGKKDS